VVAILVEDRHCRTQFSYNLCVNGINFSYLYAFSIGFWKCSECVVFLYHHISSRSFSDILQKHVRHLHITQARCVRHYINMLKFVCDLRQVGGSSRACFTVQIVLSWYLVLRILPRLPNYLLPRKTNTDTGWLVLVLVDRVTNVNDSQGRVICRLKSS
jgi:hypothetical protein